MTWPRSLRARLTALFLAISGVAILGTALLMNSIVDHAVWGPLDAELAEEAETLCTLVAAGYLEGVQTAIAAIATESQHGPWKFVRVMRSDGSVIGQAGPVPKVARDAAAPRARHAETITVGRRAVPMRVLRYPGHGDCGGIVGAGVRRHVATLVRARIGIASSAILLLMSLGGLAWLVTGRATADMDQLAEEVATIEAGSLGRRLLPRRTLEVDRLASVLNRLLARLESAVTHLQRFTADAAHELRTPVAALRARLEVAIGGPATAAAYRDGLVDSLEQTERLGRLAEDLLTLSAVEAGSAQRDEEVRLDLLAREVVDALEPVAQEQGRTLDCDAPAAVSVRGAPQLLKRVVLNLVDNAFRHTPPGAPVRVAVSRRDGFAEVVVEDRGLGMSRDDLANAFQRFTRGRAAAGGSGLGLALCREIVVAHGGRIDLASEIGRGTRVVVELP